MTTLVINNIGLSRVDVSDLEEGDVVVMADSYRVKNLSKWKGSIIVTLLPQGRISFSKKDWVFVVK